MHRADRDSFEQCVIIGTGNLGSAVARRLGERGLAGRPVPTILLVDPDRFALHNLEHSPALRVIGNAGEPKAIALARWCNRMFPQTEWRALATEIADVGLAHLSSAEVLFSCTDNALARVETAYAAKRLGLPMMDGGLKGSGVPAGRVAWYAASVDAGCYVCQLSEQRRADLLAMATAPALGCVRSAEETKPFANDQDITEVTAAAQVSTAGVMLHDAAHCDVAACDPRVSQSWGIDATQEHAKPDALAIPRSVTCPFHEPQMRASLTPLVADEPIAIQLARLPGGLRGEDALLLDWPQCLEAICSTCGASLQSPMRLAWLRRQMKCPACGSANLHPTRVVSVIRRRDSTAALTPEQLGLPEGYLGTVTTGLDLCAC